MMQVFIAVAHDKFKILGLNKIKKLCKNLSFMI